MCRASLDSLAEVRCEVVPVCFVLDVVRVGVLPCRGEVMFVGPGLFVSLSVFVCFVRSFCCCSLVVGLSVEWLVGWMVEIWLRACRCFRSSWHPTSRLRLACSSRLQPLAIYRFLSGSGVGSHGIFLGYACFRQVSVGVCDSLASSAGDAEAYAYVRFFAALVCQGFLRLETAQPVT